MIMPRTKGNLKELLPLANNGRPDRQGVVRYWHPRTLTRNVQSTPLAPPLRDFGSMLEW
jgi:hypothetical protein